MPRRSGSKQKQTSGQRVGTAGRATRGRTSLAVALGVLLHLVAMVGDQPPWGFLVHARGLPPTGQLRLERVAIRATTSEPAPTSPAATTRRTAIGGSGRRRQPPRVRAWRLELGAYRLPSVAGAGPVVNCRA